MRARKQTDYDTDKSPLKGKNADTMQSMFDKKGQATQDFHK